MFSAGGVLVPTGGRPKKTEGKVETRHVRIHGDLAEMLSWVLAVLGKEATSAQVLDPFLRGPITGLFNKHKGAIDALKAAQKKAKKSRDEGEAGE
jgi:hypothetical protein